MDEEAKPLQNSYFPLSFGGEGNKGVLEGLRPSQKYFPFPLIRGRG